MKLRTAALCTVLIFSVPAAGRAAAPPPDVMKTIQAVVDGANALQPAALAGLYDAKAAVIDEEAPFVWNGASAGQAWLSGVVKTVARLKLTRFKAVSGAPTEYRSSAGSAYVILPQVLSANAGSKRFHETGTFTFTLRKVGGAWKITGQVWTTASMRMY